MKKRCYLRPMGQSTLMRGRRVFLSTTVLLAFSSAGCNFIAGQHDAETFFIIDPSASGSFFGWSTITVDQDVRDVEDAELLFVRLELPEDSPAQDLTFMRNIVGQVVIRDENDQIVKAAVVAQKEQMPVGEPLVVLDLVYDGDLRDFFPDGHTIRMEWTGERNPAVQIPEGGVKVLVKIRVQVG